MSSTELPSKPLSKLHYGLRMEALAEAWYLERQTGASLLARNFRWRGGEIDLIFEEPSTLWAGRRELVFIEVRARLPGAWVDGVQSVSGGGKIRRLRNGIALFLAQYHGPAYGARLDLLAWDGTAWEHWKDAAPPSAFP